jgi:hypothetical protein
LKLDRNLNLTQKLETDSGACYIHSTPISRVEWEEYFYVLSQTYASLFMGGLGVSTGPTMAALMLRKVAKDQGVWDGEAGVQAGLMGAIRRLTNVVVATDQGWQTIPYEVAVSRRLLDEEAQAEVENALVFFICVSSVLRGPKSRPKLLVTLGMMRALWDAQTTPLDVTAFASSLTTSTPVAPITPSPRVSSLPS